MTGKTPFIGLILTFIFASSVIVLTFFSPFATTVLDIIHNYTALGFNATTPSNTNNITSPTPLNNTAINHTPVANAGVNQVVNETDTVILNGIASDPDPGDYSKLTYLWTQVSGPHINLKNGNTTNPSFIAPTVPSDRV